MSTRTTGKVLSYEDAAAVVAQRAAKLMRCERELEEVKLASAMGRVLAAPLRADADQPPFTRSTRDGYACRAAEASRHTPLQITGATHAGLAPLGRLGAGCAWEIMTGAPVPQGADAVMMLEDVEATANLVTLQAPRKLAAGENIVEKGAQGRAGEKLVPSGTLMTAGQIALAAACGYARLHVFKRPLVAIMTTGDEIVPVGKKPRPGQIRNSNAPMLASLVEAVGGEPWLLPAVADTAEALDRALAGAEGADLLIVAGGVSAGKYDLVEPALKRAGARFHFTGARIQPGKPVVFGELQKSSAPNEKKKTLPFFGLPGNPVSSAVTFLLFAAPIVRALSGNKVVAPQIGLAEMPKEGERHGKAELTRFLPAYCDWGASENGLAKVEFVPWHGSGDLTALARANCFLVIPEAGGKHKAERMARILLY